MAIKQGRNGTKNQQTVLENTNKLFDLLVREIEDNLPSVYWILLN